MIKIKSFKKNPLIAGFLSDKKFLITLSVALICLGLFSQFSTADTSDIVVLLKAFTLLIFFFVIIPLLYIRIILKKQLKKYGWQMGNWRLGVFWGVFSLLLSLALAYIVIYYLKLPDKYTSYFADNFWVFILYEILVIGLYVFLYEFFFRGFLMFSLEKKFGRLSPLIQFLVFLAFYWLTNEFTWQNIFFFTAALFSGWITLHSRSILYSLVYSWLFILIADAAIIYLKRYI
jgi:membrane protease YdiL (CAAX protease family)